MSRYTRGLMIIEIMAACLAAALTLFPIGCGEQQPVQLEGVEVREYKGKDLSSVATDFVENTIKGPQYIDQESYRLEVGGLVDQPREFTYDEILSHQSYSKVSQLLCVEGWSVDILWEGMLVRDLFQEVGVKPEANTVILYAVDGYSTSFPLSWFYDKDIIMAWKMNDITIPPERGFPFHLVAEDKWGYKWIKWITKIELSNDPDFRGYWESRGYNQDGARTGPKIGR
ncbi:MAG: molybdopterin-dependent oxidoreductase [Thermoleophilia bacterium]|nr:molybdopterin-dependent oxidoreductase [Thermoleophilia bacterium]